MLIECCVEFITLVSSEANDISEKEAKKTIACDHISKALDTLGFSEYVPAVLEAAAAHKETQKVCALFMRVSSILLRSVTIASWPGPELTTFQVREKRGNKFEESGMSIEELQRLQEEQFAAARERHNA